jgi:hypothetical protein
MRCDNVGWGFVTGNGTAAVDHLVDRAISQKARKYLVGIAYDATISAEVDRATNMFNI